MNKLLKITAIVMMLVIAFSAFYYFVVFLPQHNKAKLELEKRIEDRIEFKNQQKILKEEQEKAEMEQRQKDLEICLAATKERVANVIRENPNASFKDDSVESTMRFLEEQCYNKFPIK